MAAGDLSVNAAWATIECDDTVHTLTVEGVGGSLTNIGAQRVYLAMDKSTPARDGLQHADEVYLDASDSIPIPAQATIIKYQCAAGQTTKLWYIPRIG